MATTIEITEELPFDFQRYRVWTSPSLLNAEWTERPFLRPISLSMVAGPDVDEARFEMEVGFFTHRGDGTDGGPPLEPQIIEPLQVDRQYVKIDLLDENGDVADIWVGRLASEEQAVKVRSRLVDEEDEVECKSGTQSLVAYGLLWELEHTIIASSWVKPADGSDNLLDPERGIPFNFVNRAGGFALRGNMDTTSIGDPVFSWDPVGPNKWDASTALEYLCKRHSPQTPGGNESVAIDSVGADLSWYDISVETDRRSFKAILDELVDRRRLAGYYLKPKEVGGSILCDLTLFTFTDVELSIGSDTIPANEDQVELVVRSNAIAASCTLRSVATHVADRIIVEGAQITSTATWTFSEGLEKGWTNTQETEYLAGAGGVDEELNTAARSRDHLKDVFSRVVLADDWNQALNGGKVTVQPESLPDVIADADVAAIFNTTDSNPWRHVASRFLDYTAIKDSETDEFRRPFVVFPEPQIDGNKWVFADQASIGDRQFACHLHMLHDRAGYFLVVNKSGGNSLLASGHWAGAAATPDELDPTDADNRAFGYEDASLTATVEWDDRASAAITINGSGDGTSRVQRIYAPDARLDFVLPGTFTDIDSDGELVVSTGSVLRDDRARLRTIAEAAAAWYGVPRRATTITYRSLRQFVSIGQLLTSLVDNDLVETVNTPITGIGIDFREGTTTIETSYAEADFSSNRAGVGIA